MPFLPVTYPVIAAGDKIQRVPYGDRGLKVGLFRPRERLGDERV
jgi:hypothetical protein